MREEKLENIAARLEGIAAELRGGLPGGGEQEQEPTPEEPETGPSDTDGSELLFAAEAGFVSVSGNEVGKFPLAVDPARTWKRLVLKFTIDFGPGWNKGDPDGIHGLAWLFEGAWPDTLGYVVARGGDRNIIACSRNWELEKKAKPTRRGKRFRLAMSVPRRFDLEVMQESTILMIDGELAIAVPRVSSPRPLQFESGGLDLWLGNPDHRPHGPEVPSLGWHWYDIELRGW